MNLRDALIAGSAHGTDRLSVDADRRLRRRLGLESATSSRRVWVWPALGAFAAAAVLVIVLLSKQSSTTTAPVVTAGSADVAAQTWHGAEITAAPGTQLTKHADRLVLTQGAIEIVRPDQKPMVVEVPMGRVVIASYRSRITAERESFTILLDDGTGQYTDAAGQTYPIAPNVEFVWPRPAAPVPAKPVPAKPVRRQNLAPGETPPTESSGPPGVTKPVVRPDTPCTFKSDCEEGATCRKNEHGASVCMGHGGEGAACWFDNDCTSNLCVSRRCAP